MLDAIIAIGQAVLNFLGIISNPQAKRVEDVLPEKSASEQALEDLQKQAGK